MQTLPNDINLQSLIIGFYGDAAGNVHGFTRHPDGHFQNFDFPGADITFAWKVNDLGQLAGQYTTNFPGHGFVLTNAGDDDGRMSASNYFSFDYPDSQGTAARGHQQRRPNRWALSPSGPSGQTRIPRYANRGRLNQLIQRLMNAMRLFSDIYWGGRSVARQLSKPGCEVLERGTTSLLIHWPLANGIRSWP